MLLAALAVAGVLVSGLAGAPPAPAAAPGGLTLLPLTGALFGDVVVTGNDHAYVTSSSRNRVEVVNLATTTLEPPITVGASPLALDLSADGTTLYVANYITSDISVVDLATRAEVRRIPVSGPPIDLAVTSNGTAFVSLHDTLDPAIEQVDLTTGALRRRTEAAGMVQSSRDHARILAFGTTVAMYEASTDTFTAPRTVGPASRFAALDMTGRKVVANPGTLVLDETLSLVTTVGNPDQPGWSIALNPSGTTAFQTKSYPHLVEVLDMATEKVVSSIALPSTPEGNLGQLGVTADGSTLVVPTSAGIVVVPVSAALPVPACVPPAAPATVISFCGTPFVMPDLAFGGSARVYVANKAMSQVDVVSVATRTREAPIPVGSQPQSLDLSPDGGTLYTANMGARDISVVDLALRREVRRIPVTAVPPDERPTALAVASDGTLVVATRRFDYGFDRGHILRVDPASGAVTVLDDLSAMDVVASGDRSRIAVVEGAFVSWYVAATGLLTGRSFVAVPLGTAAVDRTGATVLLNPGTLVLDQDLTVRASIPGGQGPVAVDQLGTVGLRGVIGEPKTLQVLDLARGVVDRTVVLPEAIGPMALSPDGATLAMLNVYGLSIGPIPAATARSAYAVWSQPVAAGLDAVGTWVVPATVPTATAGQLPPSYLYGHYFNFTQSPDALGVIGLVTAAGTKLAAFGVVDGAGTPHSVGLPFDWMANRAYYLFAAQLGPATFGGWVFDNTAATWTYLGQVDLPAPLGKIASATVTQAIWFGPTGEWCSALPRADVYFYPAISYAGGGVTQATLVDARAGSTGTCPATVSTESSPWARLVLGAE